MRAAEDASPVEARVLVADDSPEQLYVIEQLLLQNGFAVVTAEDGPEAVARAREIAPDIVILDVSMPRGDGLTATQEIKADPVLRYTPVVLVTANTESEQILEGFRRGADDYVKKPYVPEELLARIRAMLRLRRIYDELRVSHVRAAELSRQLSAEHGLGALVGTSPEMRRVFELVRKVADSPVPVLIAGESGTGKELVARALHASSDRKERAFVAQNCSAFNEQLLESELFGHVRGAFTGAVRDKPGLFEVADGGTFFLDELGEMSAALQAKLLRVLEDGSFTPVGSTKSKVVDVRVIAATHRNLPEMVKKGSFREDLYYRLNVMPLELPPLRERPTDIPLLVEHFLRKHTPRLVKDGSTRRISHEALQILCRYAWPGNVRQLENEIERAILLSGDVIAPGDLSNAVRGAVSGAELAESLEPTLREAVEALEKGMIARVLEATQGNKSEAAKRLGIARSNLITKVRAYGLGE